MSSLHVPKASIEGIRQYEESHRPTSPINVGQAERWASAIGGTLLVAHGLRKGSFGGLSLAILGGSLMYRGVTGHCQAYQALNVDTSDKHEAQHTGHIHQGVLIKETTTVNRPADELHAFWRDVENSTKFMSNIKSVKSTGDGKSHWVSEGPMGKTFEWDSEIINDQAGRLIAWKSLPGGDVDQAGSVRFEPATGGRGTIVTLEVNYEPPAGVVGQAVAKLLGQDPAKHARENLRHFKQLMETGEIPTIEGQSSGRTSKAQLATPIPHPLPHEQSRPS